MLFLIMKTLGATNSYWELQKKRFVRDIGIKNLIEFLTLLLNVGGVIRKIDNRINVRERK
jgi:hypothetical protein